MKISAKAWEDILNSRNMEGNSIVAGICIAVLERRYEDASALAALLPARDLVASFAAGFIGATTAYHLQEVSSDGIRDAEQRALDYFRWMALAFQGVTE